LLVLEEVKEALRKMKSGKAIGPNLIPVKIWKCLGEVGLDWLTELFNVIFRTVKIPNEWKTSTVSCFIRTRVTSKIVIIIEV